MAKFHTKELSWDSYLINYSTDYTVAALASWLEFWLSEYFGMTRSSEVMLIGIFMCALGHYCRVGAMFHAGRNFHHVVQTEKAKGHVLVTDGIYSWLRHPSYFGWSVWAVGSQLILGNPVCAIAYLIPTRKFFAERIPHEEEHLVKFFGDSYIEYCKRVPIRMPGIKTKYPCCK